MLFLRFLSSGIEGIFIEVLGRFLVDIFMIS